MKKVLIGTIVLIVLVAGFFLIRTKLTPKTQQPQFATIEVSKGNIEVKVLSTGTIKPFTRVEVNSPVSGRIEQTLVDEGDLVKPGDILAWISSEDRIALLDAARAILERAQKTNNQLAIQEAQESYEIAEKAYKPVPLTNSISGQVIARSCERGQNINTQTPLFVISDRLVASVTVDEADIGKIAINQDALITLDAFPSEQAPAKVTKIAKEGKVVSDVVVYNVLVEPLKVPSYWASGMTANVQFDVVKKENVLVIPNTAIKRRDGKKFVLVASGNQSENRTVETGATDGKNTEIINGLQVGEKVLIGTTSNQSTGSTRSDAERRARQMMRGIPGPGMR